MGCDVRTGGWGGNLNDGTHFVKGGAHSVSTSISQSRVLEPLYFFCIREMMPALGLSSLREIGQICSDECGLLVVITIIQYVADRVPYPLRYANCAQFVNQQYVGIKDRS